MGIPLLITAFGSLGKLPAIIARSDAHRHGLSTIALVEYHQSDPTSRKVFGDAASRRESPLVISAALGILWSGSARRCRCSCEVLRDPGCAAAPQRFPMDSSGGQELSRRHEGIGR